MRQILIIIIITKHELVEWMYIDLALAWLWVQTLENLKLDFIFAKLSFGLNVKG